MIAVVVDDVHVLINLISNCSRLSSRCPFFSSTCLKAPYQLTFYGQHATLIMQATDWHIRIACSSQKTIQAVRIQTLNVRREVLCYYRARVKCCSFSWYEGCGIPGFWVSSLAKNHVCKDVCKIIKAVVVSVSVHLNNNHYVDEMCKTFIYYVFIYVVNVMQCRNEVPLQSAFHNVSMHFTIYDTQPEMLQCG